MISYFNYLYISIGFIYKTVLFSVISSKSGVEHSSYGVVIYYSKILFNPSNIDDKAVIANYFKCTSY